MSLMQVYQLMYKFAIYLWFTNYKSYWFITCLSMAIVWAQAFSKAVFRSGSIYDDLKRASSISSRSRFANWFHI